MFQLMKFIFIIIALIIPKEFYEDSFDFVMNHIKNLRDHKSIYKDRIKHNIDENDLSNLS